MGIPDLYCRVLRFVEGVGQALLWEIRIRVGSGLHRQAVVAAAVTGVSLSAWMKQAFETAWLRGERMVDKVSKEMRQDGYDDPRNHHIICACYSDEHTLRLTHFKADPERDSSDEVYWSVYLNPYPWYKRLWVAVRYVFGYRSKFGSWDSGPMMGSGAVERLRTFLAGVDTRRL